MTAGSAKCRGHRLHAVAPTIFPNHLSPGAATYPIADAEALGRWGRLVGRSPYHTPYASPVYLTAVREATGARCDLTMVEEEGEAVAGAALFWRRRGPYREVFLPPFTQFSAFALREPLKEASVHGGVPALEALLDALEARYHVVRLLLPPAFTDVRCWTWRRWHARPLYTYHVDLDTDDVTAGWSTATRRTHRVHDGDYRVVDGVEGQHVASLCAAGYGRHDRPPPLFSPALATLIDRLAATGLVETTGVASDHSAPPDAAVALLHDDRTAYYWVAGSRPGPAMTVLLGHLLKDLRQRGLATLDFVGANTSSIAEFKRRFGARLVPFYRVEKTTRPELRLLYALKDT